MGDEVEDKDLVDEAGEDDSSEFSDAFAEAAGVEKDDYEEKETDDSDEEQEADEEDEAGNGGENDIWSNATEEQRNIFERERQEREKLEHRLKSDEGRVSALQRKINELQDANKSIAKKPLGEIDDEMLKDLIEEYPELQDKLVEFAQKRVADEMVEVNGRIQLAMEPMQEIERERYRDAQRNALADTHPDFQEYFPGTEKGKELDDWLETQPEAIQKMANSDDAVEVSSVLTYFKAGIKPADGDSEAARVNERRRRQLQDSTGVGSSRAGGKPVVASDDFSGAFAHFSKKFER